MACGLFYFHFDFLCFYGFFGKKRWKLYKFRECRLCAWMYRGADKSLARPGRKQANVSVRMARISFGALPCRKRNLTARVSMLLKSRASLTCFLACFLPGQAKDLSAPRYLLRDTHTLTHTTHSTRSSRNFSVCYSLQRKFINSLLIFELGWWIQRKFVMPRLTVQHNRKYQYRVAPQKYTA